MTVVKRDGTREPYSKSKIERGLRRALEKRPVTDDQMMQLLTVIEQDIQLLRVEEVSTEKIGEIVIRRLRDVDLVAYIRFASVYKSFNDLTSFKSEIEKIY